MDYTPEPRRAWEYWAGQLLCDARVRTAPWRTDAAKWRSRNGLETGTVNIKGIFDCRSQGYMTSGEDERA